MSNLVNKLFSKLLAVIAIFAFVVGIQELILTDEHIGFAFEELLGALPFVQVMGEIVCNILKCQYDVAIFEANSFWLDLLRLALMACIQPLAVGILTAIFLPMPQNQDFATQEEYMETLGYKVKEMLVTIVSAPLLAIMSSWFTEWMLNYFYGTFGKVGATILSVLSLGAFSAISIVPLLMRSVGVLTAIVWRLFVTLGAKMLTTFVTNTICVAIYFALLGGVGYQIIATITALVIWLIFMDLGVKSLQMAIVGKGAGR